MEAWNSSLPILILLMRSLTNDDIDVIQKILLVVISIKVSIVDV